MNKQDAPVALVTGSAIRVGRAIASGLVRAGFRVWIHAHRSRTAAAELVRELGPMGLGPIFANLEEESERERLIHEILRTDGSAKGRLNLLVNNAASFEQGPFLKRNDNDLRRVLETNLIAPLSLARRVAGTLAAAADGQIINIVDLGALAPARGFVEHCIAKAGLAHATRALAYEFAPHIRCNAIAPGTVLLPPTADYAEDAPRVKEILTATPQARLGSAEELAETVLFLIKIGHLNGQIITVDGGRSLGRGLI